MAKKVAGLNGSTRRTEALKAVASRGGSATELAFAQAKVAAPVPAIVDESAGDKWVPAGQIIRVRRGARAFLRQDALVHFLKHIKEGQVFTNRTIPMSDVFGSGDFYVVLGWMLTHSLAEKYGSRYEVRSKKLVVGAWNDFVERMKLS